ncbi:hypothetical protein Pelo_751 [Pelomyxa schiedti]|nr:hypothetical protein Pelo_751 [Pelomyxa schiedti]
MLSPASLSIIGREWIVFPAREVVVGIHNGHHTHKYVAFSVSPTLGLVTLPVLRSCNGEFQGWVGPLSSGVRFALVSRCTGASSVLSVVDTKGQLEDVILTDILDSLGVLSSCRRWAVGTLSAGLLTRTVASLWNFDSVETGTVNKAEHILLPWKVQTVEFDGDASLVISRAYSGSSQCIVIDLEATLAQKKLVIRSSFAEGKECIGSLICWKGITYALLSVDNEVLCLTNGQKTAMHCRGWSQPVGGPYYAIAHTGDSDQECILDVCSVTAPSEELIVKYTRGPLKPKGIQVIDALTGCGVLQMNIDNGGFRERKPMDVKDSCGAVGVSFKDHIDARNQLIAFGAGVIVGRCGRDIGSPVSVLTPASLSIIGRDWVVFPARDVVLTVRDAVVRSDDGGSSSNNTHKYVAFSVSPTHGLAALPKLFCFTGEFRGWVGPFSSGVRFALVESQVGFSPSVLSVVDTKCQLPDLILTDSSSLCEGVPFVCRRWAVGKLPSRSRISLWNFDSVDTGSVKKAEHIAMPWRVQTAEFCGDGSLVASEVYCGCRRCIVIDLDATLAQKSLVISSSFPEGRGSIEKIICWKGMTYALLSYDAEVLCLENGRNTAMHCKGWPSALGGPYYAVESGDEGVIDVCSVTEPSKAHFGNQLIVKDLGIHDPTTKTLEIIEAATGCVLLRMSIENYYLAGVL